MGIAGDVAKKFPPEMVPCGCKRHADGDNNPLMGILVRVKDGCDEDTVHPCDWCMQESAEAFWLFREGKITEAAFYRRLRRAGKPR